MKFMREKHLVAFTCDGIMKKTKKIRIQSCDTGNVDSIHDDVPVDDVDWVDRDEDVELSE